MPSSRHEHISYMVSLISELSPRRVLDVGCGFGRWGFLAREYCDIFHGRYHRDTWLARIDAVEVFADYLCPHHQYIYDAVHVCRAEDYAKDMPRYDLIIAGDVIEHLDKPTAVALLSALRRKCDMALVVSVPLGDRWPQGEVLGNPNETHRSVWTRRELRACGADSVRVFRIADGRDYGVAVWTDCPRLGFGWRKAFRRKAVRAVKVLRQRLRGAFSP